MKAPLKPCSLLILSKPVISVRFYKVFIKARAKLQKKDGTYINNDYINVIETNIETNIESNIEK